MSTTAEQLQVGRIGESVPRSDGTPKVKGEFVYGSDLWEAGMLWGQTLPAHTRTLGSSRSTSPRR